MPRSVLAPVFAFIFIFIASLTGSPGSAGAQSPAPQAANTKSAKSSHVNTFSHAGLHGITPNRPISAAACHSRAMTMSGSPGQLGPNGPSQSQTIVAVPINGKNAAAATQAQQLAEACSHIRR